MGKKSHSKNEEEEFSPGFVIVTILILLGAGFLIFSFYSSNFSPQTKNCGDGTPEGLCSELKPYYCFNKTLIQKASLCGCENNFTISGESCTTNYQKNSVNTNLKYYLRGEKKYINITIYPELSDYLSKLPREIEYSEGEIPSRKDFKLLKIDNQLQNQFLNSLVVQIENTNPDKIEQMRIAVSLVQNIEWGFSNKSSSNFGGFNVNYSRFPYEVLYDSQGLCGEKSELLAIILKKLGFSVALFYNQQENHESLGIKCPQRYSWKYTGYCFVETTGPSIITDSSIPYVGGLTLDSSPEVIPISEGISLNSLMYEYDDAKALAGLRNKKSINYFDKKKLKELEEKYGLVEEYRVE